MNALGFYRVSGEHMQLYIDLALYTKVRFFGITFWQTKKTFKHPVFIPLEEVRGAKVNLPLGFSAYFYIQQSKVDESYQAVADIKFPDGTTAYSQTILITGPNAVLPINMSWRGGSVKGNVTFNVQ